MRQPTIADDQSEEISRHLHRTVSKRTELIRLYNSLSAEDRAIVDRVLVKIQMQPKKRKSL